MKQPNVILTVAALASELEELEGRSFQVHLLSGSRLRLVSLSIRPEQCPVILGGEQCSGVPGHPGKHQWGRGD